MRKKPLSTVAFITGLLFLAVTGTLLVNSGKANPFWYRETIPIPKSVKRPTISINPLINNTLYAQNEISLTLNVSIPETRAITKYRLYLVNIWLQRDWNDNVTYLYKYPPGSGRIITHFSEELTLADIPDGSHNVTFTAYADGGYLEGVTYYDFDIVISSTIRFSVDTTSPIVTISSIENRTYKTSDIPLNFTVSEPVTEVSYSLDGLDNVTVAGNTTLAGLSIGEHNVTVFATDEAGNTGASEKVFFTITEPPEPFPVVPVATASIASVAVLSAGFLVYFKKRKH